LELPHPHILPWTSCAGVRGAHAAQRLLMYACVVPGRSYHDILSCPHWVVNWHGAFHAIYTSIDGNLFHLHLYSCRLWYTLYTLSPCFSRSAHTHSEAQHFLDRKEDRRHFKHVGARQPHHHDSDHGAIVAHFHEGNQAKMQAYRRQHQHFPQGWVGM